MINISQYDQEIEQEWQYEYYQQDSLISLLSTSSFEGHFKEEIENEINDTENMNEQTYNKLAFKLFTNQLDRISSGLNYSATDILHHLRKFM